MVCFSSRLKLRPMLFADRKAGQESPATQINTAAKPNRKSLTTQFLPDGSDGWLYVYVYSVSQVTDVLVSTGHGLMSIS